MAKTKPSLLKLNEMTPGQFGDFFALLVDRTRAARKDGKPFYTCKFRDRHRTVSFVAWSDGSWFEPCQTEWRDGQFYKIRGYYDEHPVYGPQIDIQNLRPTTDDDKTDGFDPLDFVDRTRHDVDAMFLELCEIAESKIADESTRAMVVSLLKENEERWKRTPGSQKNYYPFAGGLLEHTLSVTKMCLHLADKYCEEYTELEPPLNRDVVVAGAILHDIGRLAELSSDVVLPQPTVDGRLIGHLILGRDMVRSAAAKEEKLDPERLRLLEHVILTHLTLPEWGSPRGPMIPEVLIVHHADDLDAKMEMYVRCLLKDKEAGDFTARDPVLGKTLYKGRSV